jgi:hypothetical protein
MTHTVLDYAAVGGLVLLGLLAGIFSRRILRPVEKTTVRAAAWSLLSAMRGDEGDLPDKKTPASSD